jgi:DNA-directed RNA polymerase specialized sigma24 family protein
VDAYPATEKEWGDLLEKVRAFAYKRTGSKAHADDLAPEACTLLMTTRRWDPSREPVLAKHMMKIVMSLLSNARERERVRAEYEMKAAIEERTTGGDSTPSAGQLSIELGDRERSRIRAARKLADLRASLGGFDLELQLIDLTEQEIDERAEQARITGRRIEEVYEAWRRIRRYLARLPDAGREDDDDEEVA